MEARPVPHPSADSLRAFGLGKMDDPAAQALMSHLDSCPECRQALTAQSGDDFLDRFRQAHGRSGTPAPAKSLAEVDKGPSPGGTLPTCHPSPANLPPELADHPKYEVLRELGRGGMGIVYLAKNKPMDRLEVLKVVNKTLLEHPGAIERFQREIRSAARLSHANIVTAFSVLHQGDLLAFAMEYIPGQDLAALVKARGPLPVPYACYYAQQAAFGLQHAFEKGMVHRDIKPQNLMLTRDGAKHILKILDFGLAKATREQGEKTDLTGEGRMLGTPDFMAPEQTVDAARADIRADIYSLGCTLYYLLSGGPPFTGRNLYAILQAHHSVEARALNLVRAEVPEGLAAVVCKMMAKDPAQRYQKPIEVVQALAPFIRQNPPPVSPAVPAGLAKGGQQAAPVPQVPSLVWDPLAAGASSSPQAPESAAVRTPSPAAAWRKWGLGSGIGAGLLLLTLLVLGASGVFKVKTKNGTIVLENVPDGATVHVDGDSVQLDSGDGKPITITLTPGTKHRLQVTKEGFKVFVQEIEIDAGERRPIRVTMLAGPGGGKPPPTRKVPALIVSQDGKGHFLSLRQAVREAPANSRLLVRPGRYQENLVIRKRLEIVADKGGKVVIESTDATPLTLVADGIQLRGLTARTTAKRPAVDVSLGKDVVLEECDINSSLSSGLVVTNARTEVLVRKCKLHDCKNTGCDVRGGAKATFEDSRFAGNDNNVAEIFGGAKAVFQRCKMQDNGNGVFVQVNAQATLKDCTLATNGCGLVVCNGAKGDLHHCKLQSNRAAGIHLYNKSRIVLVDCDIESNSREGIASYGADFLAVKCRINHNKVVGLLACIHTKGRTENCDLTGNGKAIHTDKDSTIERNNKE